jgi:hypothetical protein
VLHEDLGQRGQVDVGVGRRHLRRPPSRPAPMARVAGRAESELFIPGTLLRLELDNTQPVAWGMPAETAAFFAESPAFTLPVGSNARTIAKYADENLLMSGWLVGEDIVEGTSAVLEAPVGQGRAVVLGFRVQHRAQSHGTYKLLFNSLYLGGLE